MAAKCNNFAHILSLPNELLSMILVHNNYSDILNFASTCKYFHKFVSDNQYLWKEKYKQILPEAWPVVEKNGGKDWLTALKQYFSVKHEVITELQAMPSKHYWQTTELTTNDVGNFIKLALAHNMNHYYIVHILQAMLRKTEEYLSKRYCKQPYTLTEMHYAKTVLFYLSHPYLAIIWFQRQMKNKLRTIFVLNFFIRWIDPMNDHTDDAVESVITILYDEVDKMFPNDEGQPNYTVHEKVVKGLLNQKDVLHAISDVIFRRHRLVLQSCALDSLDIVQVLKKKEGHATAIGVIYQAVAERCGVLCNLISFPNHFFLTWCEPNPPGISHNIDLKTGNIVPSSRCPYSRDTVRRDLRYCPDTFLQYIVMTFIKDKGNFRNWSSRNAMLLEDFLQSNPIAGNPYKNYKLYLMNYERLPAMAVPLDKFYIDNGHLKLLGHLMTITYNPEPKFRPKASIRRHGSVLFYVGMICQHLKYDYLCVIRSWNPSNEEDNPVYEGYKLANVDQPHYNVVALDGTERYVAQDSLAGATSPLRLPNVEEVIAKDFTHFDGYCYVPNKEKEQEYPDDGPIRALYNDRLKLKRHSVGNCSSS